MTHNPDSTHTHGKRVTTPLQAAHPLDPLTADEIARARQVLVDAGRFHDDTRVPRMLAVDPPKDALARWRPGDPLDRRIKVTLLERSSGHAAEAIVSLDRQAVESYEVLTNTEDPYGQPQYLFEEYADAEAIVKASPEWQAAMRRRGLAEHMELAFCSPLAPGFFGREDEVGRRLVRSHTYLRFHPGDNPWAHPIEGLVVHVDLTSREVVRIDDEGEIPVPEESGDYTLRTRGPARTSLKPIEITQPEGPSFSVDGSRVQWENWTFRVGFTQQEGLVLNQITFADGGEDRSVAHRASVPEMVVPYGDTSTSRYWISYFDAGEYLLGKNANSLSLGCDCLGVIHYFDAFVPDDHGHPVKIPQAVCMHEEDYGILYKHTDLDAGPETRRSRRLVISYFSTVGNYDYGFFWYFYLDGSIQVEAKATGIVFAGAGIPGSTDPHRTEIAPGIFTPVHQHLFCARIDVDIDGPDNTLHEIETAGVPMGPDNPYGNAFTWTDTQLRSESEARRLANGATNRVWEVRSGHRRNHVGRPTAYWLIPEGRGVLAAQPESTVHGRATFATHHLWGTRYAPDELYPAGDYPNAHAPGAGLPDWTSRDRSLDGEDLVLWHVFGPTHIPRTEDWPIMPVDYSGFWFKPHGFLDRNPAMDLPADPDDGGRHSAAAEAGPPTGSCCSTPSTDTPEENR
ncbi:primary-amine oxidase [Brevibacterium sanguinis]|uniref:Amine oxidase n=2 Tax=Brevibacterium TaxID=1696 RepID=A0A366IKH6_9MICO|nr:MULTISPECIES: primary-amine oxidase [Brevibacterium]RBP64224.1 primary-amine oxidase [Brevibacterium sanguinis]RBP71484.1 primary-amine oxidase [Brevibacterium celere]